VQDYGLASLWNPTQLTKESTTSCEQYPGASRDTLRTELARFFAGEEGPCFHSKVVVR
jgi:hypothetical protein